MHYQIIMTRTILAAALFLAAACGEGGGGGGEDGGWVGIDAENQACIDTAVCMLDMCGEEFDARNDLCQCNSLGELCQIGPFEASSTDACDSAFDAMHECGMACGVDPADYGDAWYAFAWCHRESGRGHESACDDEMAACYPSS